MIWKKAVWFIVGLGLSWQAVPATNNQIANLNGYLGYRLVELLPKAFAQLGVSGCARGKEVQMPSELLVLLAPVSPVLVVVKCLDGRQFEFLFVKEPELKDLKYLASIDYIQTGKTFTQADVKVIQEKYYGVITQELQLVCKPNAKDEKHPGKVWACVRTVESGDVWKIELQIVPGRSEVQFSGNIYAPNIFVTSFGARIDLHVDKNQSARKRPVSN